MTSFRNVSAILAAAFLMATATAVVWGQDAVSAPRNDAAGNGEVARLVAVLQSDAAPFEKAKACQHLARIGTKDAVPALAALLADERLSTYARFGLEPIADPSVDAAFRAALETLHGDRLIGVIHSVGFRRDRDAVPALTRLAADPAPEIASRALAALGEIATPEAVETLEQSLAGDAAAVRAAAADACLVGAERLLAQGKRDKSVRLYDAVRRADVPREPRVAATRGAILAREIGGVPLLLEQLKTGDEAMIDMALRVSRELPGSGATTSLVAELDRLPEELQVRLIRAIGDRQDAAALPSMRQRAAGGPEEVRSAAMCVLGQLGDASAVPILLEAALSAGSALGQTAQESLKKLPGSAVDEAILAKLEQADPATRVVLLGLVGRLAITGAVPAVLRAADAPEEPVRLAAIAALGRIIGLKELAILTDRLLQARSPQETAAVEEALKIAIPRMPDPDACVGILSERLPDAPIASKCFVIELIGSIGGEPALAVVAAAAGDSNEDLQDAATRALGTWKDATAAPELLKLAKTLPSEKFRVRTLRGYLRIAQQMKLSDEQKLAMCDEALAAAQRDEERRLALNVLSHVPSAKALSRVTPHLASPSLAEDAATAALAISEKIVQSQPRPVAEAMRQVQSSGASPEKTTRAKSLEKTATAKLGAGD